MTHQPPLDQRIVDEYFRLASNKKTKDVAWLYGMIATYGLKPEELRDFDWGPEASIFIFGKKRAIRPFHPQWVFLFELKEKQPRNMQSRLSSLFSSLYEAITFQNVELNITDLVLAHKIRKNHYRQSKQLKPTYPAFAGVS
jgi:hypothetical protein